MTPPGLRQTTTASVNSCQSGKYRSSIYREINSLTMFFAGQYSPGGCDAGMTDFTTAAMNIHGAVRCARALTRTTTSSQSPVHTVLIPE